MVIARLRLLEFFNGSPVTHRERQDAERAYFRAICREKLLLTAPSSSASSEGVEEVLQRKHPRYSQLLELFGKEVHLSASAASSSSSAGANTLAAELISVTLHNLTFSSNGSLEPASKRLPRSLSILKLRLIVKQLFGLEPHLQLLSIRVRGEFCEHRRIYIIISFYSVRFTKTHRRP